MQISKGFCTKHQLWHGQKYPSCTPSSKAFANKLRSEEKKERVYTKSEIINIIEASKPKKENNQAEWVKTAREKYERDQRMFDGQPDRGELDAAIEAHTEEQGFNRGIDQYEANLKKELK